jgi:hypothetical protein
VGEWIATNKQRNKHTYNAVSSKTLILSNIAVRNSNFANFDQISWGGGDVSMPVSCWPVKSFTLFLLFSENKPLKISKRPTEPENKPSKIRKRPTEPENKPSKISKRPTEPENKPSKIRKRPTEPENKPSKISKRPTQPENKPSKIRKRPTEPENKPSKIRKRPTEPENKPSKISKRPTQHEKTSDQNEYQWFRFNGNKYLFDNFYCCTVHFDNIKIIFSPTNAPFY